MTCPAALIAARSAELSAQARRMAGFASGTSCTMYLRCVPHFSGGWKERADHVRIVILELCDHPIAGACASQSKEEVVALRVDYRAWRWREDLEERISVSKICFPTGKRPRPRSSPP